MKSFSSLGNLSPKMKKAQEEGKDIKAYDPNTMKEIKSFLDHYEVVELFKELSRKIAEKRPQNIRKFVLEFLMNLEPTDVELALAGLITSQKKVELEDLDRKRRQVELEKKAKEEKEARFLVESRAEQELELKKQLDEFWEDFNDEEIEYIQNHFALYDRDCSGELDFEECMDALENSELYPPGQALLNPVVERIVRMMDMDGNGTFRLLEFFLVCREIRRCFHHFSPEKMEAYMEIFKRYDADDSGFLDGKELQSVMADLNLIPSTKEEQDQYKRFLEQIQMKTAVIEGTVAEGVQMDQWSFMQFLNLTYEVNFEKKKHAVNEAVKTAIKNRTNPDKDTAKKIATLTDSLKPYFMAHANETSLDDSEDYLLTLNRRQIQHMFGTLRLRVEPSTLRLVYNVITATSPIPELDLDDTTLLTEVYFSVLEQ